jgi:hypothetical protein
MNRFLLCLCVVFISSCHHQTSQKVVARVDNYCITQEEFDEAYNNSSHALSTRVQSRQDFLNNMINQKLILLDAQAHGLDKDKEFLKMVEAFWQQSLLTMALKEKSKEGVNLDQWVALLRKNSKVEIYKEHVQ